VQILTLAEGDIGHLHVGFKGTMNALFLKDLGEKTHRGLRGRAEAGKSAGGICYGYRAVPVLDGQPRGDREIHADEAAIVRRIFDEFGDGVSAKAIAKQLNTERVPGPLGFAWSPSTVHGQAARGTGILNNELYIGRLVWNRLRYIKDPDTGKRVSRLNPPSSWIVAEVPHLRIVDDESWQLVKVRQSAIRRTHAAAGVVRLREPKYLFSGLTKCGSCGGGYILSSHDNLVCNNARNRGTCSNRRLIKRQEVEGRVLRAMREKMLDPGGFARVCKRFTETVNRIRRERRTGLTAAARELAAVDRQIDQVVEAVANGFRTESMLQKLHALEERKRALRAQLETKAEPALHPSMAQAFRSKVAALTEGLEQTARREKARAALRGIVEAIVIPAEGLLRVVGNLASMLALAQGRKPAPGLLISGSDVAIAGCGGSQLAIPTSQYEVAA
jgi:hypothetical protein